MEQLVLQNMGMVRKAAQLADTLPLYVGMVVPTMTTLSKRRFSACLRPSINGTPRADPS